MKVLRTSPTFYPHVTGPAYQAYRISAGLEKRGHESPLVTTSAVPDDDPGYPPEIDGTEFPFDVTRHRVLVSVDQYRVAPTAVLDAARRSYDLVHTHGYFNAVKDVIFPVSKFLRRKPFIVSLHGSLGDMLQDPTLKRTAQYRFYNSVFGRITMAADAVVVNSEQEKEEAIAFGVPGDSISVIPVGKDPETYTTVPRTPPDDRFRVLFVGRLAPRRNVEMLLRAVAMLDSEQIELRVIGGEGILSGAHEEGYLDRLKSLASDLGVNDRVTFTGAKYGQDLIEEFRSAHVFVNPSHYENFGQANLEAAFAGLPLIATPTGVTPELIEAGETGYLVEETDVLAERLDELAADPDRCLRMGERIQQIAMDGYRWETIMDQYESLYADLLR